MYFQESLMKTANENPPVLYIGTSESLALPHPVCQVLHSVSNTCTSIFIYYYKLCILDELTYDILNHRLHFLCVCIVYTLVHVCMGMIEVGAQCLPLLVSTLFFEISSN